MFVFFKKDNALVAVPVANVVMIRQLKDNISIKYHSGNFFAEIADISNSNTDVETIKLCYSSEVDAVKKMKDFYWAMSKNTGAFMF